LHGNWGKVQASAAYRHLFRTSLHRKSSRIRRLASRHANKKSDFYASLERLRRAMGIDPGIVHLANSAAIVTRPEDLGGHGAARRDSLWLPSRLRSHGKARGKRKRGLPLKPVMSLRSRIISLRNVAAGAGVGYNATFCGQAASRASGFLAAGYGDGIHRSLGNRGKRTAARGGSRRSSASSPWT